MRKNKWVKITALASFVFLQSIYALPVWAVPQGDGYEVTETDTAVGVNSDADNDHNWLGFDKEKTTNNTAIGANAKATAGNSTAIGAGAQANAKDSVALGTGSIANEAGTVSVGSKNNERRITNVADGVNPTDAVNKRQLDGKADQSSLNATNAKVATKADQSALDATNAKVATKADQSALDATNAKVATKADQSALDATNAKVATKADQSALDATNAIVATKADQSALDATNATVATKADQSALDTTNAKVATKADQSALDATNATVATKADQSALDTTNAKVATKADQSYVDTQDKALDNRITNETQRLDSRIDTLSDRVDKVGALAAAFSALAPMPYDPASPTQISMGVGTYSGEQAMAIGVYHYVKNDVLLNAGFAISGSEKMGRAGVTWKIGGPKDKKVSVAGENSGTAINSNVGIGNEKQPAGVSIGVSDTEKTAS